MIESIRELFQKFIAPQLESIKGEIKALDSKFDARIDPLDSRFEMLDAKVGSFRAELLAEIRRVEEVLSSDFVRLEQKVDLRLANMDTQLASTQAIMEARFEAWAQSSEAWTRSYKAWTRSYKAWTQGSKVWTPS